jgi:hypothetical protein
MFRFSHLPLTVILAVLLVLGVAACEGTPDTSIALNIYAPVNQAEGKSAPVMDNVFKIRMGVFEKQGGAYQPVATYKFDDIVKEYIACSATFSGDAWTEIACTNCVEGDCSSEDNPPVELKTKIESCQRGYAELISAGQLGYAECAESEVLNDERIGTLELPDFPTSATRPYTYVVEGFGDMNVESTDCCGNCEGTETSCNEGWTCRANADNLNVCMRTMTNSAVARGISAPTIYSGDDKATADIMFSRVMDFATSTTPDGEASLMNQARSDHGALSLPDGNVLLIGGEAQAASRSVSTFPSTAEIYDPFSNTFEELQIGGSWTGGRSKFAMVDLGVTGGETDSETGEVSAQMARFFIAGGITSQGPTGELYLGTYTSEDGSVSLNRLNQGITPVSQHTATLMADGNILVVGGLTANGPTSEAYIVNPFTGAVTPTTTSLTKARYAHSATLMPNGNIVIVGGLDNQGRTLVDYIVEVYNPETGQFSSYDYNADEGANADTALAASRAGHIAIPLAVYQPDGTVTEEDQANARVAIWGGYRYTDDDFAKGQYYYYNMPSNNEGVSIAFVDSDGKVEVTLWTPNPGYRNAMDKAKSPSPHPCVDARWVWLGDSHDTIFVVGGRRNNQTEYSDWSEIISFVGGQGGYTVGSFEFGSEEADTTNTPFRVARLSSGGRGGHTLTKLTNGMYLVTGGSTYRNAGGTASNQTLTSAEAFNPPTYNRYGNIFEVVSSY